MKPDRSALKASSSSARPSDPVRAKHLPLNHAPNLRGSAPASTERMPAQSRHVRAPLDSANFAAASRLLQSRLDAGLTQLEVAALTDSDPKTVWLREQNRVGLGPLRQLVLLERARDAKLKGGK